MQIEKNATDNETGSQSCEMLHSTCQNDSLQLDKGWCWYLAEFVAPPSSLSLVAGNLHFALMASAPQTAAGWFYTFQFLGECLSMSVFCWNAFWWLLELRCWENSRGRPEKYPLENDTELLTCIVVGRYYLWWLHQSIKNHVYFVDVGSIVRVDEKEQIGDAQQREEN